MQKAILLLLFISTLTFQNFACTGGVNDLGLIVPTAGYQTILTSNGEYVTVSVTCGNVYNFDFCANGGNTAGSIYPEISILDITGVTEYAFSPYSGGCSTLSWTASFTGTIRVLVTETGCNTGLSYSGTMAYNEVAGGPIDTSFGMTVVCGGGTSTVTGTPGGVFSFNSPPGGAQIDASTGLVSNGTVGVSYTVEYTLCGSSSTQTITVLEDDCWTLNGNAQYINVTGENCIQLTAASTGQIGCSWNGSQLDFNSDFTLTLDYFFGGADGADGSTFTFQPGASTACGQAGGQLGAGNIANSLVVEFDTYDNDSPGHVYDMLCDHIAIEIDGNLQNGTPAAGPVCAKASGLNIDDGATYTVDIQWNATAQTLDVYFDNALRLSYTNDIVNNVFGGQNMVYWGATAATGGLTNQQYFCPSTLVILPAEIGEFNAGCDGVDERIEWTTISERQLDYFLVEYTYDNIAFFPIEEVKAVGNSTDENSYSIQFKNEDKKQRYYRLKSVDENGEYKSTSIIMSLQCNNGDLIQAIYNNYDNVTIVTSENATIQVVNTLGQVVFNATTENQFVTFSTESFNNGIYFIRAEDVNGVIASERIIVQ